MENGKRKLNFQIFAAIFFFYSATGCGSKSVNTFLMTVERVGLLYDLEKESYFFLEAEVPLLKLLEVEAIKTLIKILDIKLCI